MIQRMEEVLVWLQLVPVEYRRLLWFRAKGWSWRKLGGHFKAEIINYAKALAAVRRDVIAETGQQS